MSLHNLIAQGGRNIASPVERYLQQKKENQAGQMNRLSMLSTRQSMDINAQKQQILKQEQTTKSMASVAQYMDRYKNEPVEVQNEAFNQLSPKFEQMGLPPLPEGSDYQKVKGVLENAKLQVFGEQEKFSPIYKDGNIVAQQSSVTDRAYADPRAPEKLQRTMEVPYESKGARDKGKASATLQRQNNYVLNSTLSSLAKKIKQSDKYIGGATGNVVKFINSAREQYRQITGKKDLVVNGRINTKNVAELSKENADWLRSTAMETDTVDSAVRELAYVIAKSYDPTGKLSDRDIIEARAIIGSDDRAIAISKLADIDDRVRNRYGAMMEEAKGSARESWYRPLGYEPLRDSSELIGDMPVSQEAVNQQGAYQKPDFRKIGAEITR